MFGLVLKSMQLIQDQVASLCKNIYLLACMKLRRQEHNLVHKSQLCMCY